MSLQRPSQPDLAGMSEPAFPPVVIVEAIDGYTMLKQGGGMTKLELAAVQVMGHLMVARCVPLADHEVTDLASVAAFAAEEALAAAAIRQRIGNAIAAREQQLHTGTIRADQTSPTSAAEEAGAMEKLAEVMQFLCDTHQLAGFKAWQVDQAEADVYHPAEAERMMRGDPSPSTPEDE